jgi:hypothetical protein
MFQGFKFCVFKILWFQGFKVLRNQDFEVSSNLDFMALRLRKPGFKVSRNKGFRFSSFQGFRVWGSIKQGLQKWPFILKKLWIWFTAEFLAQLNSVCIRRTLSKLRYIHPFFKKLPSSFLYLINWKLNLQKRHKK